MRGERAGDEANRAKDELWWEKDRARGEGRVRLALWLHCAAIMKHPLACGVGAKSHYPTVPVQHKLIREKLCALVHRAHAQISLLSRKDDDV
jgi:hypothetical protein